MNRPGPNIVYYNRRKAERRKQRGLQSSVVYVEPNPFSRRMGTDRRGTIVVYTDPRWASVCYSGPPYHCIR